MGAINQHKQLAMTGKCGCETKMKKGGAVKAKAVKKDYGKGGAVDKMMCGGKVKK